MTRSRPLLALLAIAACAEPKDAPPPPPSPSVIAAGIPLPPAAAERPVTELVHGEELTDPYRWLEDTTSVDSRAWITAQRAYSDSVLARLVQRDSLERVVQRAYENVPTLDRVMATSRGVLLTRWMGSTPSVFMVDSGTTSEREVINADTLAARGNGASIRALSPSWDGSLMVVGTTDRGDANAALSLYDTKTGRALTDRVPDLLTTTSGTRYEVTWLPDGRGYFYPRLWPGAMTGPSADRLARGRQFLHMVGTPQSSDVPVFGFGVSKDIELDKVDLPTRVYTGPTSKWLVGSIFRSKANGTDWYFAPLALPITAAPAWKSLASVRGRVSVPQLVGDTVYALSFGTADRGQVVRRFLRADGDGQWDVVIPQQSGVITAFSVQRDGVYFVTRERGAFTLLRLAPGATTPTKVTLPQSGTVRLSRGVHTDAGVNVMIESSAAAPHWLHVGENGARVEALLADDGSARVQLQGLVTTQLEALSTDSARVPISITYSSAALRNGKLDGTAPLLVESYSAFGSTNDPAFMPIIQAWVQLGGVYAHIHARGGGELGESWHTAAMREHKHRTIEDVIAAIETLIEQRYTSAGRVTLTGVSFGANIPGQVMLERPDLLGTALYEVGQPDEIRGAQLDPTAARNIAEIGDLDSQPGIQSLVKASPYYQVPARVKLPAVLVHSASDDYNFGTQMLPAKFVARLQRANSGTRPVLWLQTGGGHRDLFGQGPQWAAKALSFALWQSGVAGFQPVGR